MISPSLPSPLLNFSLPIAAFTHPLLLSPLLPLLFSAFSPTCHSPSLSGGKESQAICIPCHNSVRNKLWPSLCLSPQHACRFNGHCQLQERWIPAPLPHPHPRPHPHSSLHYAPTRFLFKERGRRMQINTFNMMASASNRCSQWCVSHSDLFWGS